MLYQCEPEARLYPLLGRLTPFSGGQLGLRPYEAPRGAMDLIGDSLADLGLDEFEVSEALSILRHRCAEGGLELCLVEVPKADVA